MSVESTPSIVARRAEIDALDEEIISLLEQRVTLSRQIQQIRMGVGGSRLAAAREQRIVQRYADRLGERGTQLAGLVLELSRGSMGSGR